MSRAVPLQQQQQDHPITGSNSTVYTGYVDVEEPVQGRYTKVDFDTRAFNGGGGGSESGTPSRQPPSRPQQPLPTINYGFFGDAGGPYELTEIGVCVF